LPACSCAHPIASTTASSTESLDSDLDGVPDVYTTRAYLRVVQHPGAPSTWAVNGDRRPEAPLTVRRLALNRHPVVSNNPTAGASSELAVALQDAGIKAAIAIPAVVDDEALAVL